MNVQEWLDGPYDLETKREIERLKKTNPQELIDAFFKELSFGTGGLRGLMGVGTNRMNVYTVRRATQGLANYLNRQGSVFIGYDVRHNSRKFAEEAARVLAGNGIRALLSREICPTPLVSFACRYFSCSAGIVITASHNPPQYNGYKVYWSDGGQIVLPHDAGIMREIGKVTSLDQIRIGSQFEEIGDELDIAYLAELKKLQRQSGSPLKIIYSNLHGTGIRIITKALKQGGFINVSLVEKQSPLDGQFSTVPSPNPEEEKALEMGSEQLLSEQADLLLATDPDADRVGVAVRHQGTSVRLTGNQIACLCLHHICTTQKLPPFAAFIKTIVTTELFKRIAESFGGTCFDVLTGFKYIGEQIGQWEKGPWQFLFGAEESYGYLRGTFVRDKDAIGSCCLIAEVAAAAKKENQTLVDRLYQIYREFGVTRESLTNLSFPDSKEGFDQMQLMMKRLRSNPPIELAGQRVVSFTDFLLPSPLPRADVLRFILADESKLIIRPSGTEPKVKIYAERREPPSSDMEKNLIRCESQLTELVQFFTSRVLEQ